MLQRSLRLVHEVLIARVEKIVQIVAYPIEYVTWLAVVVDDIRQTDRPRLDIDVADHDGGRAGTSRLRAAEVLAAGRRSYLLKTSLRRIRLRILVVTGSHYVAALQRFGAVAGVFDYRATCNINRNFGCEDLTKLDKMEK